MKIYFMSRKFFLITILCIGCSKTTEVQEKIQKKNPVPSPSVCTETATIDYSADCLVDDGVNTQGCSFSFSTSCLSTGTPATNPVFIIDHILTTGSSPALLQNFTGAVPQSWFESNNQLECTFDGASSITCTKFGPLSDEMYLIGTVDSQSISLLVNVSNESLNPASEGTFTECGYYSHPNLYSVAQSIYDCSKRVKNFAGRGNGTGAADLFIPGAFQQPEPYWFLHSCISTIAEECAWLSPVIQQSIMTNLGDMNGFGAVFRLPTRNGVLGTPVYELIGHRLLWSGELSLVQNEDNFMAITGGNVGNIPASTPETLSFDLYVKGGFTYSPFVTYSKPVCYGPNYNDPACSADFSNSFNPFDDSSYFPWYNAQNICTRHTGSDLVLYNASQFDWQLPSYPILLILTGGRSGLCEAKAPSSYFGYPNEQFTACINNVDATFPYVGQRAADSIPGFMKNLISGSFTKDTLNTSVFNFGRMALLYLEENDTNFRQGSVQFTGFDASSSAVRCLSVF